MTSHDPPRPHPPQVTAYHPEQAIDELREALRTREGDFRAMAATMARAAEAAASQLWPGRPDLAEAAGIGAIAAAATVAPHAAAGTGEATMLNAAALFGMALVDQARAQTQPARRCKPRNRAPVVASMVARRQQDCTDPAALSCPVHGLCTCSVIRTNPGCGLHGLETLHAKGSSDG